jgi:hypothetical protein
MANFTVSPGSDAASAIDAALAEARLSPGGDTITIAAGTYELTRAIQLTAADSGTTFTADGDVTLSGGGREISLIHIEGATDVTISGFNFVDTAGSGDYDNSLAAVEITGENGENTANITVTDSTFENVAVGVSTFFGANHVTVSDSTFTDTWGAAINFNDGSSENTATRNTILRPGAEYPDASGIELAESWGNTVSHNQITDSPRHAIEEQNWDPTNKSGASTIEYNRITNYMGATEDGGAIYLFGGDDPFAPADSAIRYNRIEGTSDPFSWGIYLDDLLNGVEITGNWIDGGGVASLMIHGGDRNQVSNNVLLNGDQYGITVQTGLVNPDDPILLDNIHDNIIAPGTGILGASDARGIQFHDNLYVAPIDQQYFGWDYETFEEWQASGGDAGSVVVTDIPGGIGDPDNPIDGPDLPGLPDLPPDFIPDLPNFNPDWDPILGGGDGPDLPEPPDGPDPEPPDGPDLPDGVGLDTLVLQLAADYIVTAPSFIVSVDGEEVGEGEVTVRYGENNQTFEFRGDWGAGEHEVALDFTNDNPIRNLWVEDVYYNDANYNPPGGDVNVGNLPGDRLTFTVGS